MKGSFLVLDGCEGAGKSTQLRLLKEHFGDRVVVTREPGGSPYAEEIREVILNSPHAGRASAETMFALFWAARADHIEHTIRPALEAGKTVISDRFDSTTFMYQLHGQEERGLENLFWAIRRDYLGETTPDLYIFFDVDPETSLRRKAVGNSEMNHFDERDLAFHERVREGMRLFAGKASSTIIDGSRTIDEVQSELCRIIEPYIESRV